MLQLERRTFFIVVLMVTLGLVGHFTYPINSEVAKDLIVSLGLHNNLGGHHFADQQMWMGIPNTADVLSNLPFAIFGICGLWLQAQADKTSAQWMHGRAWVLSLFFVGLICTAIGSSLYHLAPSNKTLVWDRAGMAFAFAGLLGIAASERISARSGLWLAWASLSLGLVSLAVWVRTDDVLPWSIFQFGGMALVLALALIKPASHSLGISLVWVIVLYGAAKVFESADQAIFDATWHTFSGHTLKHLVASLAALPVIGALQYLFLIKGKP